MIRERQKAAALARGEEWVAPEVQAEIDEKNFREESERIFAEELQVKCQKKGLNYAAELEKHKGAVAEADEKKAEKKRLAFERAAAKAEQTDAKRALKLSRLTPEQLAAREEKAKRRQARDDAAWAVEREKGKAFYTKIQAELAAKQS